MRTFEAKDTIPLEWLELLVAFEVGDVVQARGRDGSVTCWVLLWKLPGKPLGWMQCPTWPQPLDVVLAPPRSGRLDAS